MSSLPTHSFLWEIGGADLIQNDVVALTEGDRHRVSVGASLAILDTSMTLEIDATAQVAVRLHPTISLGYRWVERKIDVSELFNESARNQTALGVRYMW